jgi:hypothetical protein
LGRTSKQFVANCERKHDRSLKKVLHNPEANLKSLINKLARSNLLNKQLISLLITHCSLLVVVVAEPEIESVVVEVLSEERTR